MSFWFFIHNGSDCQKTGLSKGVEVTRLYGLLSLFNFHTFIEIKFCFIQMSMWSAFMITKIYNRITRRLRHALTLNNFWPNLILIHSKAKWEILTDNSLIDYYHYKYDWDFIWRSSENTANSAGKNRKYYLVYSCIPSYRCFLFLKIFEKTFRVTIQKFKQNQSNALLKVKRLSYYRLIALPNLFFIC